MRRFWRGDPGQVPELASRLTGSSDIFAPSGRRTYASVNFVTCHDGFTLTDLVGYEHKHNEANGEDNRDGTDENYSRNWGAEGATDSVRIQRARDRMKRNFLTTLLFSQGVRMLLGGDEIGRSQQGNNNAYCQDNEISWLNWDVDERRGTFTTSSASSSRSWTPTRSCAGGTSSRAVGPTGYAKDVTWIRADGQEMTESDWSDPRTGARDAAARAGGRRGRRPGQVRPRRHFGAAAQRRDRLASTPCPSWPARHMGGAAQHGPTGPGTDWCAPTVNLTAHSAAAAHTEHVRVSRPRPTGLPDLLAPPTGCSCNGSASRRATELVDYLERARRRDPLRIAIIAAAPGGTHGYDVVDPPARPRPRDGGRARRVCSTRSTPHGMRLLVDVVPNHMAAVGQPVVA